MILAGNAGPWADLSKPGGSANSLATEDSYLPATLIRTASQQNICCLPLSSKIARALHQVGLFKCRCQRYAVSR